MVDKTNTTENENLKDVDEALMFETNNNGKMAFFMDYSKLSEDTKFCRLKR